MQHLIKIIFFNFNYHFHKKMNLVLRNDFFVTTLRTKLFLKKYIGKQLFYYVLN